jgi:transposase
VAALKYRTGVDDPRPFSRSRTVGAHLGMTPRKHNRGMKHDGRISRFGDREVRPALFAAAAWLLQRCTRQSAPRA